MRDKYKPWALWNLFEAVVVSIALPVALAIFSKRRFFSETMNLVWIGTVFLLITFIAFFARDRWCCSKKDEQIDSLEIDATKYRKNHDTEIEKQYNQRVTEQATKGYVGRHGMHQLNDKIN